MKKIKLIKYENGEIVPVFETEGDICKEGWPETVIWQMEVYFIESHNTNEATYALTTTIIIGG